MSPLAVLNKECPFLLAVLRAPQASRLLFSSLVGRLPLGAVPLALVLFGQTFLSVAGVGALVAAYTLGVACGQPVLSRLADRFGQPRVMWGSLAMSTVSYLVLVTHPATVIMMGVAVLAGFGAPPLEPCLRVLWRDVVGEEALHRAYALDVAAQELIFIAGPLVTVAAVASAGPSGGLYAAVLLQAIGTLAFVTASAARRWRGEFVEARHWAGPLRSANVRVLTLAILFVGAGVGGTVIAVGARSPQSSGWLLSAQAAGALAGGILAARFKVTGVLRRLPWLVGIFAVSYAPLVFTGPQLIPMFVSGIALPAVLTYVFSATSDASPPGTATESFAWVATAFGVGSALGAAANGAWFDAGFVLAPCAIAISAVLMGFCRSTVATS